MLSEPTIRIGGGIAPLEAEVDAAVASITEGGIAALVLSWHAADPGDLEEALTRLLPCALDTHVHVLLEVGPDCLAGTATLARRITGAPDVVGTVEAGVSESDTPMLPPSAEALGTALAAGARIVLSSGAAPVSLAIAAAAHAGLPRRWEAWAGAGLAGIALAGSARRWGKHPDTITTAEIDGTGAVLLRGLAVGIAEPEIILAADLAIEFDADGMIGVRDVAIDPSTLRIGSVDREILLVSGARGFPPSHDTTGITRTEDGWRAVASTVLTGSDVSGRAELLADGIDRAAAKWLAARGLDDFRSVVVQAIGAGALAPSLAGVEPADVREVVLRVEVEHDLREGAAALAAVWHQASAAGRLPARMSTLEPPEPVVRLSAGPVPVETPRSRVLVGGRSPSPAPPWSLPPGPAAAPPSTTKIDPEVLSGETARVPLSAFAHITSAIRGNDVHTAVVARRPEFLDILRAGLQPETVAFYMDERAPEGVARVELVGIGTIALVFPEAAMAPAAAPDPEAATWAMLLEDFMVEVPARWVEPG